MPRFEVLSGRDGRFMIRDGRRRFVVPADLGARLQGADGEVVWRELLGARADAGTGPRGRRGLWLRLTILPARVVAALARRLRPLAAWPVMVVLAVAGLTAVLAVPLPPVPPLADSARAVAPAMAMFLLTALVHELGHATALAREGWSPGSVGMGLLWVLPVFWCDVSAVAAVPRAGRVRVDLGGVCAQLPAAGALAVLGWLGGWPPATYAAHAAVGAVVWSLLPFLRTDGYWLGCDLLGLADLAAPAGPNVSGGRLLMLAAWRLTTAASLALIAVALPLRLHGWLTAALPDRSVWAVVMRAVFALVMVVGALRALRRCWRLLVAVVQDRPRRRIENR